MFPSDRLEQVEKLVRWWLTTTKERMSIAERSQAEMLLARWLRAGYQRNQLAAVHRHQPKLRLVELLEPDIDQKPTRFARLLAATPPEYFHTPAQAAAAAQEAEAKHFVSEKALAHLREFRSKLEAGEFDPPSIRHD